VRCIERKRSNRAASDNITHGSWIIAAVAVGALAVSALAIPGGPVHHWLTCNVESIADINGQSTFRSACAAINVTSIQVTNPPGSPSFTTGDTITVSGQNLPVLTGAAANGAGTDYENFALLSYGTDFGDVNPIGGNAAFAITVLQNTSTKLAFTIDLSTGNYSLAGNSIVLAPSNDSWQSAFATTFTVSSSGSISSTSG